jgi:ABC-type uncharacterized transport system permease subunit
MIDTIGPLVVMTLGAGTPLIFAALGELVTEKSGVLNLGVEGMMLVGAIVAFITTSTTGSLWLGVGAGCLAGAAMALLGKKVAAARGHVQKVEGVRTVATFHPAFLMNQPSQKDAAWADLLLLTEE